MNESTLKYVGTVAYKKHACTHFKLNKKFLAFYICTVTYIIFIVSCLLAY